MQAKERGDVGEKRLVAIKDRLKKLPPMDSVLKLPFIKSSTNSLLEREGEP